MKTEHPQYPSGEDRSVSIIQFKWESVTYPKFVNGAKYRQ